MLKYIYSSFSLLLLPIMIYANTTECVKLKKINIDENNILGLRTQEKLVVVA